MPRDVRNPILGAIAAALALAPLALLAYTIGPSARLDAAILRRLAEPEGSSGYDLAMTFVHLGDPAALLAMLAGVVVLGLAAGRRRRVVVAVALVLGANLSTQVLKHLLAHPRFQTDFAGYHLPWADAFPSGHTTAAASIAAALVLVASPRLRTPALALGAGLTAAVALAVIVLQWHYLSDVIGALLVVACWTCLAVAVLRLTRPRRPASPSRDRSRPGSGRVAVSLE
jgi:membrane-associated phospholipid phosphatase